MSKFSVNDIFLGDSPKKPRKRSVYRNCSHQEVRWKNLYFTLCSFISTFSLVLYNIMEVLHSSIDISFHIMFYIINTTFVLAMQKRTRFEPGSPSPLIVAMSLYFLPSSKSFAKTTTLYLTYIISHKILKAEGKIKSRKDQQRGKLKNIIWNTAKYYLRSICSRDSTLVSILDESLEPLSRCFCSINLLLPVSSSWK